MNSQSRKLKHFFCGKMWRFANANRQKKKRIAFEHTLKCSFFVFFLSCREKKNGGLHSLRYILIDVDDKYNNKTDRTLCVVCVMLRINTQAMTNFIPMHRFVLLFFVMFIMLQLSKCARSHRRVQYHPNIQKTKRSGENT